MTSNEKLLRDIDTLRKSIQEDRKELASNNWPAPEREQIRQHADLCIQDLRGLIEELEQEK